MVVIINGFEVELESPASAEAGADGGAAAAEESAGGAPAALSPLDIRDVLLRQWQRELRVRAH